MNWNLKIIYEDENRLEEDIKKFDLLVKDLSLLKGTLGTKGGFMKYTKLYSEAMCLLSKIFVYASMKNDLNQKDMESGRLRSRIYGKYSEFLENVSYIEPELLSVGEDDVLKFCQDCPSYKHLMEDLFRRNKHILKENEEVLMAYYSDATNGYRELYSKLTIVDNTNVSVTLANGKKVEVNKSNMTYYLSILEDPSDRTKVFNAIYKFYNDHKATLAGIYEGIVKSEYANMKARGYKSMVEAKLDSENIPVSVYESLMKTTRENTSPLKRYYSIRKKYFKLDKIRTYDRFLQFRKSNMEYSYPKVKEMVLDAMNFMGSEYKSVAELCLSSGRVDVDIKDGKRNGAYSTSTYPEGAFILLNHNGDLPSAFTVAHECGHSIHSTYTNRSQDYINSEYSIFVAEVASTFNEHMFLDYLMNKVEDKNEKIVLLQQAIDNICATYYRQTLFATFEYEAHKRIEEGHSIDDRALSDIMKSLYKDYYDIDLDEEEYKSLVWAYIPHFFNSPFYVYQYATSFSASMKLYDDIKNKKKGAYDSYINLLKSGASNYPVLLLKEAGCDLTKEDAFIAVVKRLDSLLDILEDLLK